MATQRQRVLRSLRHEQPDQCPYHVTFTQPARKKMAEYYGDKDFEAKLGNCFSRLRPHCDNEFEEISPDIWQDQFGVQWDRSVDKDIGTVCNQVVTPENVKEHQFPDPDDPVRYSTFENKIAESPDNFRFVSLGFSLFERAWTLAGMENILMGMVSNKNFVNTLLDRIVEFNLKIIENSCKYNIDAMRFGDDWGQQRGLIMGPRLWQEFIKPRIREMYKAVKTKGKYVIIHSCGKVEELFPDLIECGLDLFNPFQPEAMDIFEIKKAYGDKLSFFGGISIQQTLPFGTVSQTQNEVKCLIDKIGKNGGYIAAPSHDIPGDAKPENIAAMIEVLQNQ